MFARGPSTGTSLAHLNGLSLINIYREHWRVGFKKHDFEAWRDCVNVMEIGIEAKWKFGKAGLWSG